MGYLNVDGKLMTYNEYKDKIPKYKVHGLKQFVNLYNIHKDKKKDKKDLHWGEEIEYSIYHCDDHEQSVKLYCDAKTLIKKFNDEHKKKEIDLQPEFGNWMIEGVPAEPYSNVEDAD